MLRSRPYSQKMQNIILNLLIQSVILKTSLSLVGTGKDKTYLCLVLTADRGYAEVSIQVFAISKSKFKKILVTEKI